MFQASPAELRPTRLQQVAVPRVTIRLGQRVFWALLLVELALVLAAFAWAVSRIAPAGRVPLADGGDRQQVVAAVYSRVNHQVPDRMISVGPGTLVRESSVRGFLLDGTTYYYQISGERGFDPLSRGFVVESQVEVVYKEITAGRTLLVYTIPQYEG
jgi:hypothetical protein